ncbi:hypothetical protein Salat_1195900 [Sesamum alatum]|uniref:Uncharacterized protein n=1 Tax=Sesamum alatum TaxID=300844 RepID=A0AAE2CP22_9LAMI|nr:hypothetical protein Salat_1195900 [Sesamum alatum]
MRTPQPKDTYASVSAMPQPRVLQYPRLSTEYPPIVMFAMHKHSPAKHASPSPHSPRIEYTELGRVLRCRGDLLSSSSEPQTSGPHQIAAQASAGIEPNFDGRFKNTLARPKPCAQVIAVEPNPVQRIEVASAGTLYLNLGQTKKFGSNVAAEGILEEAVLPSVSGVGCSLVGVPCAETVVEEGSRNQKRLLLHSRVWMRRL